MWTAGAEGEREERNEGEKEGETDSGLTGISRVQEGGEMEVNRCQEA